MGGAKRYLEQLEARGYDEIEGLVCTNCVVDPALKELILTADERGSCSFCGREGFVASADDVANPIVSAYYDEYCDPINEMPIEDGGFIELSPFEWTSDLFPMICGDAFSATGDGFRTAVQDALPDKRWVEIAWRGDSTLAIMRDAWRVLSDVSRYQRRYFFHDAGLEEAAGFELSPNQLLAAITALARDNGVMQVLPENTLLFRAREHRTGETPATTEELGAPPVEFTRSNRMSPHGISMFYAALDRETSLEETDGPRTTAAWTSSRPLRVMDLRQLPDVPSLYDVSASRHVREGIRFLYEFRDHIRRPIERDGQEAIEYVPTQVVTEYIRTATPADGIVFPSSLSSGACCVLFCDSSACIGGLFAESGATLSLIADSIERHS